MTHLVFLLRRVLHMATGLAAAAMCLLVAAVIAPAHAASYTLPGTLPAGCTGSGGNYTCTPLTLGNNDTVTVGTPRPATVTVNGNFTAGNRAALNTAGATSDLSLTVTGSVTVGNQGQINGALTAAGAITLGNSTRVAACLRSSSAAPITLSNGAGAGSVCCGALGACTSSCVVNNSGSAMPALCGAASGATAGRFNAYDTGTAAGSVSGVIHTKVAGTAFNLAVVAVNTAGTALATAYTGSVRVELLDSSNNSGTLDTTTGCRSSWPVAAGTSASTLTFATADQGRKNLNLTVAEAWRDARVRISYPATGTASVVGCSGDNFAIRPAGFANFSASDATLATAGTTRTLANTAATGGNVHKAGQPFTVRATAVNGAATPATTANYGGTPSVLLTACGGAACAGTLGTLTLTPTATAGVINTTGARYSEAGAFNLQLVDTGFAGVDAADGSTAAEMNIASAVIAVGRFVPDHFDLVSLATPVLRTFNSSTCSTRSHTYLGQPFGYATPPQATVLARNAAGATTLNYPDTKLNALTRTQAYSPLISATPGLDSSAATLPALSANGNGTAGLAASAIDTLTMVRPGTTPLAPFNAAISLSWSVADNSETGTGNGAITTATPLVYANIAFDAGSEFRYGVLKLGSAYGSELIALAVPLELQHWNGSSFVTNTADGCTSLPMSALALGTWRGNLAACETAPGTTSVAFASGRGVLRMLAPGSGNAGSADATVNLGATATGLQCSAIGAGTSAATTALRPWLQGKAAGSATYSSNPSARISFGQHRSPLIQLREVY